MGKIERQKGSTKLPSSTPLKLSWVHIGLINTYRLFFVLIALAVVVVTFFVMQGKFIHSQAEEKQTVDALVELMPNDELPSTQFPLGVNPQEKKITENPIVDTFFDTHISTKSDPVREHAGWFGKVLGKLALMNWYQNLASLSSRILVIEPGERKEQVASHFGKILGWSDAEKSTFIDAITDAEPTHLEGKFSPGTYTVARGAKPADVAPLILDRFNTEVLSRYGADIEAVVPLQDTLTLASLLEREAYDFEDMRLISGVIWNRLFVDMRLQIDATLQYAKGSNSKQSWWPQVVPADKYIASVYNTYKNAGLPPAPIANPSLDAILAALNPKVTECMYYFHDAESAFHCSVTYEEHVALLKQYYGRGK